MWDNADHELKEEPVLDYFSFHGKFQLVLAQCVTEHLCQLWFCNYRVCNFTCTEEGYLLSQPTMGALCPSTAAQN